MRWSDTLTDRVEWVDSHPLLIPELGQHSRAVGWLVLTESDGEWDLDAERFQIATPAEMVSVRSTHVLAQAVAFMTASTPGADLEAAVTWMLDHAAMTVGLPIEPDWLGAPYAVIPGLGMKVWTPH